MPRRVQPPAFRVRIDDDRRADDDRRCNQPDAPQTFGAVPTHERPAHFRSRLQGERRRSLPGSYPFRMLAQRDARRIRRPVLRMPRVRLFTVRSRAIATELRAGKRKAAGDRLTAPAATQLAPGRPLRRRDPCVADVARASDHDGSRDAHGRTFGGWPTVRVYRARHAPCSLPQLRFGVFAGRLCRWPCWDGAPRSNGIAPGELGALAFQITLQPLFKLDVILRAARTARILREHDTPGRRRRYRIASNGSHRLNAAGIRRRFSGCTRIRPRCFSTGRTGHRRRTVCPLNRRTVSVRTTLEPTAESLTLRSRSSERLGIGRRRLAHTELRARCCDVSLAHRLATRRAYVDMHPSSLRASRRRHRSGRRRRRKHSGAADAQPPRTRPFRQLEHVALPALTIARRGLVDDTRTRRGANPRDRTPNGTHAAPSQASEHRLRHTHPPESAPLAREQRREHAPVATRQTLATRLHFPKDTEVGHQRRTPTRTVHGNTCARATRMITDGHRH